MYSGSVGVPGIFLSDKPMKNLVLVIVFMWLVACNNQIETDYTVVEQSGQTTYQDDSLLNDYRLITEIGSYFYATDLTSTRLVKMDNEYNVVLAEGREGHGPGEFMRIAGLFEVGDELFVFDDRTRRVSVMDLNLQLKRVFTLDEQIIDLEFVGNRAFAVLFQMDKWSLIEYDVASFKNPSYLHVENTRHADHGIGYLYAREDHLITNHIFTNKSTLLNTRTGEVKKLAFSHLPEQTTYSNAGGRRVPLKPVYFTAMPYGESIIQLAEINDKMMVFITDFSGNVRYAVHLTDSLTAASLSERGVYGLSDTVTYFYPLDTLLKDD